MAAPMEADMSIRFSPSVVISMTSIEAEQYVG